MVAGSTAPCRYRRRAFSPSTTVMVDGSGSTLTTLGKLNVSSETGLSQMAITNGGVVQSGAGGIADSGGTSNGVTTVDGIGSAWIIQGDLKVGRFGSGMLTIANGGLVKNVNGFIGSANSGNWIGYGRWNEFNLDIKWCTLCGAANWSAVEFLRTRRIGRPSWRYGHHRGRRCHRCYFQRTHRWRGVAMECRRKSERQWCIVNHKWGTSYQ